MRYAPVLRPTTLCTSRSVARHTEWLISRQRTACQGPDSEDPRMSQTRTQRGCDYGLAERATLTTQCDSVTRARFTLVSCIQRSPRDAVTTVPLDAPAAELQARVSSGVSAAACHARRRGRSTPYPASGPDKAARSKQIRQTSLASPHRTDTGCPRLAARERFNSLGSRLADAQVLVLMRGTSSSTRSRRRARLAATSRQGYGASGTSPTALSSTSWKSVPTAPAGGR